MNLFSGRKGRVPVLSGLIVPVALAIASPLLADVKAGVDAWTTGDYAAAVREWQPAAARGDADAQFNLGQAYRLGRGVPQDMAKAEELFGKAAAQGHPQASDNYGLLLFQRGQREQALPYVKAAADRGDPRSQYLLGIAHFNGDLVPKDWVRAYALTSLAQQAGLAQAAAALTQMDQHIPLEQRRMSVSLAAELSAKAEASRARQLASADLAAPRAAAPTLAADSPRTAGADYARPQTPTTPTVRPVSTPVAARPLATPAPAAVRPPAPAVAVAPAAAASGPWRVQLGAFGVPGNAEALWQRVRARPELAGRQKLTVPSGKVTRLLAGGFASQSEAQAACNRLSAGGFSCLPTRN